MRPEHWDPVKRTFSDSWKYTIEDAAVVGQKYVISPWLDESLRKTYDDMLRYMDVFNKCGELCKSYGMKFGYHNHDFEFSQVLGNKKVYDIILQNTDPELVAQQLDIGNPHTMAERSPSPSSCNIPTGSNWMHVKDEIKATSGNEPYESTLLWTGSSAPYRSSIRRRRPEAPANSSSNRSPTRARHRWNARKKTWRS